MSYAAADWLARHDPHPASPAEMLAMLGSDGGRELVAAVVQEARQSLDDLPDDAIRAYLSERFASTRGEVLAGLVVDALRERGYRRRDVLRPEMLTGPAGQMVDVYTTAASALGSASGMRRLRTLICGGG